MLVLKKSARGKKNSYDLARNVTIKSFMYRNIGEAKKKVTIDGPGFMISFVMFHATIKRGKLPTKWFANMPGETSHSFTKSKPLAGSHKPKGNGWLPIPRTLDNRHKRIWPTWPPQRSCWFESILKASKSKAHELQRSIFTSAKKPMEKKSAQWHCKIRPVLPCQKLR